MTDNLYLKFETNVAPPPGGNGNRRGVSKYRPLTEAIQKATKNGEGTPWMRFLFRDGDLARRASSHIQKCNKEKVFGDHVAIKRIVPGENKDTAWLYVRLEKIEEKVA